MSTPISYKRDERGFTTFTIIETISEDEYNRCTTVYNSDTTLFIDSRNIFKSTKLKDVYTRRTQYFIGDNGVSWTSVAYS